MRGLAIFGLLAWGLIGEATAQSAPPVGDARCWHGSQSYSPGSMVRVGGKFYSCGAGSSWGEAAGGGANCVYEDRNFSSGALVAVREGLIRCAPSGAWEAAAAE